MSGTNDDDPALVRYALDGRVATITLDDGRANALSLAMQHAVHAALDRAEADDAAVVLAGRDGRFCAGFDLTAMASGGEHVRDMVIGGFELSLRLLERPMPTVVACTGHAMAMGAFLLLSADYRVGAAGPFKIAANEVAIGMTLPYTPIELMRMRLDPAAVQRSAVLAEVFDPIGAVTVGYLDHIVAPDAVVATAQDSAAGFIQLDLAAHAATKQRVRADALGAIREAIARDRAGFDRRLG
jgi:enoyl-CoA hydratase